MNDSSDCEFRIDVLTGLKCLIAPGRTLRPAARHPEPLIGNEHDPFAEGCESETPNELYALRSADSLPNEPGWNLRVVPNRYPALTQPVLSADVIPSGRSAFAKHHGNEPVSLFPVEPAEGAHEVIIECPDPRNRMAELSVSEITDVLIAWRARVRELATLNRFVSLAVFRNEGFSAGASLQHCHSQIMATTEMMPLDTVRHARADSYQRLFGRELLRDLISAEREDGRRLVAETSEFIVLCPFASRTSWHVRFIPRRDQPASFAAVSDVSLGELAQHLKQTLLGLEAVLGGPFSFNLTLPHPRLDRPPGFRWMLELLPRTGRHAGWEFLTAVDIVTTSPEQAAQQIREQTVN